MTKEEKLDKVTHNFSLLPGEKQDYILGVVQALAFAHGAANEESVSFDSDHSAESYDTNFEKGVLL
jgi:hypothetical protein